MSSGISAEKHGAVWVAHIPDVGVAIYTDEGGAPSRLMTRDEVAALGTFTDEFLEQCTFREPGPSDG